MALALDSSYQLTMAHALDGTVGDVPSKPQRQEQHELERLERRRMQCKLNQRTYRARRRARAEALTREIRGIQHHITELHDHCRALCAGPGGSSNNEQMVVNWTSAIPRPRLSGDGAINAILKYYSVFMNGLEVASRQSVVTQESFIRTMFCTDVHYGHVHGVDQIVRQWYKYSTFHEYFVQGSPCVETIKVDDGVVVRVLSRGRIGITRTTIENVYPHLLAHPALVARLVGREIRPHVTRVFCFDTAGGVVRYDTFINYTEAFLELLGSVEDTALVMSESRVRNSCILEDP